MKGIVKGFLMLMLTVVSVSSMAIPNGFDCWKSNEDLAYYVILEVREKYHGCLCPHDLDGYGNRCGNKSAYRRPSTGIVAVCKPEQVLNTMIIKYRETHCPESNSVMADYEETQN